MCIRDRVPIAAVVLVATQQYNAQGNDASLRRSDSTTRPSCDFLNNMCFTSIDVDEKNNGQWWGILLEVLVFAYCFLGLAIVCDDHLAVSLETLCQRFNVREDVAGASFAAFGSAAPEIIINCVTTIKAAASTSDSSSVQAGVGAILGSGMIAFLVIPSACALSAFTPEGDPLELKLKRRPLLRDLGTYAISLLELCIFFGDGKIVTYEAAIMVGTYVVYMCVVVLGNPVRSWYRREVLHLKDEAKENFITSAKNTPATTPREPTQSRTEIAQQKLPPEEHQPLGLRALSPRDLLNPGANSSSAAMFAVKYRIRHQAEVLDERQGNIIAQAAQRALDIRGEDLEDLCYDELDHDDDEGATGCCGKFVEVISMPLVFAFKWTCPDCEVKGDDEDKAPFEDWYPLTFLASFLWVALFSFTLSTIVERWVEITHGPQVFFGIVLLAVGAEIPDTIQSCSFAKRGYGSMAVANGMGSQVINILIGLGVPWLLSNIAAGKAVIIGDNHQCLQVAAFFQFGALTLCCSLLLGWAVVTRSNKAVLNRFKAVILCAGYVVVIVFYGVIVFLPAPNAFVSRSCKN
eukprot:TRINITY_DN9401_c0_g1_i1.p1 TRINITY_DN9401_c0_g1~~TRINITY_DN9401_c0_g1_i1.p1  ORF type:complete len:576 (+),score=160.92 TRINITY_DN9401_c0_g1_i1:191-1918(+)